MAKPDNKVVEIGHSSSVGGEEMRRNAILTSAADLFFKHGFDAVSVDAIIALAGGSKSTVYRLFGNKDGLFEALITGECVRLAAPLRDSRAFVDRAATLDEALTRIGHAYLDVITNARSLSIHRLVIAQAHRFPRLALTFVASGPEAALGLITDAFRVLAARGLLGSGADAPSAARQFMNMLRADIQMKLLVGVASAPTPKMRTRLLAEVCRTFGRTAVGDPPAPAPPDAQVAGESHANAATDATLAAEPTADAWLASSVRTLYADAGGTSDVPFEASVGYQVRATHRALQRYLQSKIEPYGVSLGMWYFLRVLWERDGLSQRDLSRRIGTMEPTTLNAIAAMEKRGLVRRERDPSDRRRQNVFLTPRGQSLRSNLIPVAAQVVRDAVAGLPPTEITRFFFVLDTIQSNLAHLLEGAAAEVEDS